MDICVPMSYNLKWSDFFVILPVNSLSFDKGKQPLLVQKYGKECIGGKCLIYDLIFPNILPTATASNL